MKAIPEIDRDSITIWVEGETDFEKQLIEEILHKAKLNTKDDAVGIYVKFSLRGG